MKFKKKITLLIISVTLLVSFLSLHLVSADILSVNSGGSKDIIINTDDYIEGFFTWAGITVEGGSYPTGVGKDSIIGKIFLNYTLEYSSTWPTNSKRGVAIYIFDKFNRAIDVSVINVDYKEAFIGDANLTREGVGNYRMNFETTDRTGVTYLIFDINGVKQTAKIKITGFPTGYTFMTIIILSSILALIIICIIIMCMLKIIKKRKCEQ